MSAYRKLIFANDEIYHVFNRGVEKRPTFTDKRELSRAIFTLNYYKFQELPLKLSKYLIQEEEERGKIWNHLNQVNKQLVEIICFCLMPNHFHLLLKQKAEDGISIFISNFTNSYTKYFNTRHDRIGPLFQGIFKAVRIESDEQLAHVSRYIHLNPISSFLIKPEELESYEYSSYPYYLDLSDKYPISKEVVLDLFPSVEKYKQFVLDQTDYAKQLELIKHLTLE